MIYCAENDHVWLDVFPWLVDTDNLNKLNCCEFVIDRLMKVRENWSDRSSFCGPLLFLALHYVDTVVDGKRDTTITYPRFKSWTTKELNNREKKSSKRGGFGGGFVEKDDPTNIELYPQSRNMKNLL
ncbi:hypothetical protein RND81_08G103600 [Saponaria officinalis]|uniref:Uncharacterized protein n=1 Tax=Saponaria officinalis TaxID=3572 RepID=A0AAW1J649_SAPOF